MLLVAAVVVISADTLAATDIQAGTASFQRLLTSDTAADNDIEDRSTINVKRLREAWRTPTILGSTNRQFGAVCVCGSLTSFEIPLHHTKRRACFQGTGLSQLVLEPHVSSRRGGYMYNTLR